MKNIMRPLAAVAFLFLLSCSDMGEPEILLPQLDIEVTSIDFGTSSTGTLQLKEYLIINMGDGRLDGALVLDQDSSSFTLQPEGAFSLEAGDTLSFEVGFTPTIQTTYTADIIITSNDPDHPDITIPLGGTGTVEQIPVLSLSATQIDFGTILSSETVQEQFNIVNSGTDTLLIDSMSIGLNVYQTNLSFPLSLAPGDTVVATLTFQPGAAGTYNADLTIHNNSSGSPHTVGLQGSAADAVGYAASVQPIWNSNCTGCHGSSAGLNLSSYAQLMSGSNNGAVVISGDAANSKVIQKLKGLSGSRMPLNGAALPDATIALIEDWINQGALDN